MEDTGREDAEKPCWISEGREDSRAQEDAPDKQERGGSERRTEEVKELKEEERAGTRLRLRPCRMHKARTRQETPKKIISETTKTNGVERDTKGRKKKIIKTLILNKCSSP